MSESQHSPAELYTRCVESDAESIDAMTDAGIEISYEEFCRRCDVDALARELGYVASDEPGMKLKDEPYASYHRSVYRGMPCYYMDHSCIEHVFIAPEVIREQERKMEQDDGPSM